MFLAAVRELHVAGVRRFVEPTPAGLAALVRSSVPDVQAGPATELYNGHGAPALHAEPWTSPGSTAPAITVAGPAPGAALPVAPPPARRLDVQAVVAQLRTLYAVSLGYPEEAITANADLEADLGIDSLKRAEMLSKVVAHFALDGAVNNGAFANHQTLLDLAQLVVTAQVTAS
jgi:acyl carrier protein